MKLDIFVASSSMVLSRSALYRRIETSGCFHRSLPALGQWRQFAITYLQFAISRRHPSLVPSQRHLNHTRAMVHSGGARVLDHFSAPQQRRLGRPENVIDPAIVNRRPAGIPAQVPEILQYVAVRFGIVLGIIGEQVGLLFGVKLEIEIS